VNGTLSELKRQKLLSELEQPNRKINGRRPPLLPRFGANVAHGGIRPPAWEAGMTTTGKELIIGRVHNGLTPPLISRRRHEVAGDRGHRPASGGGCSTKKRIAPGKLKLPQFLHGYRALPAAKDSIWRCTAF